MYCPECGNSVDDCDCEFPHPESPRYKNSPDYEPPGDYPQEDYDPDDIYW